MSNSYLDAVRQGKNAWWRYLISILLIGFCWLVLGSIPFFVWWFWQSSNFLDGFVPAANDDQILQYLLLSLSFCFFLLGIFLAVTLIHQRPLRSLVRADTRINIGRIGQGAALWLLLAIVPYGLEALLDPSHFELTFEPSTWLVFLPLALIFTPIQTTAEELFFRAYLLQGMSLLTRNRWLLISVTSLIFGVLHLPNPEVAASNGVVWIALNYLGFGVLMAFLTLQDNSLELAIGAHAVNNLFLALVIRDRVSVLDTPAIVTRMVTPDARMELVVFLLQAAVFYFVFIGRRQRPAINSPPSA